MQEDKSMHIIIQKNSETERRRMEKESENQCINFHNQPAHSQTAEHTFLLPLSGLREPNLLFNLLLFIAQTTTQRRKEKRKTGKECLLLAFALLCSLSVVGGYVGARAMQGESRNRNSQKPKPTSFFFLFSSFFVPYSNLFPSFLSPTSSSFSIPHKHINTLSASSIPPSHTATLTLYSPFPLAHTLSYTLLFTLPSLTHSHSLRLIHFSFPSSQK